MFLWCHVRHVNPVKIHPERITQNDKKTWGKILARLKLKATFALKCIVIKIS